MKGQFRVLLSTILALVLSTLIADNGLKYAPETVAEDCLEDLGGTKFFGRDGHLYSTYLVARYAGVPPSHAYTLAYYSEYPDIDVNYKAGFGVLSWQRQVNNYLHSLHGGKRDAVEVRRIALENGIYDQYHQEKPGMWSSGVMLHAFADAYAHTKLPYKNQNQTAYGTTWGHVSNGFKPDQIAQPEVFPKYAAYVKRLFNILKIEGMANEQLLVNFLQDVEALVCEKSCTNDEIKIVERKIIAIAYDEGTFREIWFQCIESNARPVEKYEMENVINFIKSQENRLIESR